MCLGKEDIDTRRPGGHVEVSCLVAREENAPAGVKPVVWRLLTNRLIDTFAEVAELIDWYRTRWAIELFFHVLKTVVGMERRRITLQLSQIYIVLAGLWYAKPRH